REQGERQVEEDGEQQRGAAEDDDPAPDVDLLPGQRHRTTLVQTRPPSTERSSGVSSSGTSTSVSRLRLSPRKNGVEAGKNAQTTMSRTPTRSEPTPTTKTPPTPKSTV